MSLLKSDYTIAEAIDLVRQRRPGEDPLAALVEALSFSKLQRAPSERNLMDDILGIRPRERANPLGVPFERDPLVAYIIDEKTGERANIAPETWRSEFGRFLDPHRGHGVTMLPGREDRLIAGPIFVDRLQLDGLLGIVEQAAAAAPRPTIAGVSPDGPATVQAGEPLAASRAPPKQAEVIAALKELYPDSWPTGPSGELLERVNKPRRGKDLSTISYSTLKRVIKRGRGSGSV